MTAEDIREALRNRYSDHRRYAIAEEVGLTTGFSHRRLDMMVFDCFESNGFRIDGIEIKISTGDLKRELEDPEKHIAFFDKIDYYTLATPPKVVEPLIDLIPKRWGILIVNEDGTTRYKRRPIALADMLNDRPVSRGFFASIIRNIQTHQPSETELKNAYNKGVSDEKNRFDYNKKEVQENAKKIEAYENLEWRLHLWHKDVNTALDRFEAFQNLQLDWMAEKVGDTIKDLTQLKTFLEKQKMDKDSEKSASDA